MSMNFSVLHIASLSDIAKQSLLHDIKFLGEEQLILAKGGQAISITPIYIYIYM